MKVMAELARDIGTVSVAVQQRIETREIKSREAHGKSVGFAQRK
jgi:hypothetical protein